jgi:Family of unknown function (DUF6311)
MKKIPTTTHYLAAYIIAILIFHFSYGLGILNPQNINWLLSARHDWGTHYLGWAFYRDSPWMFPLGGMNGYVYPVGANVGLTDSIPLVAIPLKIISPLLSDDFQYLGLWLLSCYLMAAHYTLKIFGLYKIPVYAGLLGVILVVANPVLFYRGMHPALCAHGFILAALYYYLVPATADTVKKINRAQLWLALLSGLINPYLCLIVLGFSFILPAKEYFYNKLITGRQAILYPLLTCVYVVISWLLVGMISLGHGERLDVKDGYGLYGFNYNSFFNSGGFSAFLPGMPWVSPHQYEGFMYMGVGIMLLIAIALVYFLIKGKPVQFFKTHKWLLPLFILAVVFSLFATSHIVTYGDHVLFEVPIPGILKKLGNIFRASGRFYWITYYLLILFFIIVFLKAKVPVWAKTAVMALLVLLQVYDTHRLFEKNLPSGGYDSPLAEAEWNAVLPNFKRIVTYPPFNNHLLNNMDYQDLSFLAVKNHMPLTVGYTARENGYAYKKYTDALNTAITAGTLNPDELYVTTSEHLDAFDAMLNRHQLTAQYLDGYYLLYVTNAKVPAIKKTSQAKKAMDSLAVAYSQARVVKEVKQPAYSPDKIAANIEEISVGENDIWVKGWAYLKEKADNKGDSVFVMLVDSGIGRVAQTKQFKRPDLTTAFHGTYLEDSGFSAALFTDTPFTATAHLAIAIKSKGTWTYADLGSLNTLDPNKKPKKLDKLPAAGSQIGSIDEQKEEKGVLILSGWTAFKDENNTDTDIRIVFVGNGANYSCATAVVPRPDVTAAMGNTFDYNNTGFSARVVTAALPARVYKLGLMVTNRKTGKQSIMMTDKTANIK